MDIIISIGLIVECLILGGVIGGKETWFTFLKGFNVHWQFYTSPLVGLAFANRFGIAYPLLRNHKNIYLFIVGFCVFLTTGEIALEVFFRLFAFGSLYGLQNLVFIGLSQLIIYSICLIATVYYEVRLRLGKYDAMMSTLRYMR